MIAGAYARLRLSSGLVDDTGADLSGKLCSCCNATAAGKTAPESMVRSTRPGGAAQWLEPLRGVASLAQEFAQSSSGSDSEEMSPASPPHADLAGVVPSQGAVHGRGRLRLMSVFRLTAGLKRPAQLLWTGACLGGSIEQQLVSELPSSFGVDWIVPS